MPSAVSRHTTPTSTARTGLMVFSKASLDQLSLAAFVEPVGDDQALDLAGSLPNAIDPQLAEKPLGNVLAHIAPAAEDLHRPVGDPIGHLGGRELGDRALGVAHLPIDAGIHLLRRPVGDQARS